MTTIGVVIGWLVFGLIVGWIGRLLVPGPDPMGWLATIGVGVAGSFVGGLLAQMIWGFGGALQPASWIGSIIGAIIVVAVSRQLGTRRRFE